MVDYPCEDPHPPGVDPETVMSQNAVSNYVEARKASYAEASLMCTQRNDRRAWCVDQTPRSCDPCKILSAVTLLSCKIYPRYRAKRRYVAHDKLSS